MIPWRPTTFLGILPSQFYSVEGQHVGNYQWTSLLSGFYLSSSTWEATAGNQHEKGYWGWEFVLLLPSPWCFGPCPSIEEGHLCSKKELTLKGSPHSEVSILCFRPVGPVAAASSDVLVPFLHYLLLFPYSAHNLNINNFSISFPWIFLILLCHLLVARTFMNWGINIQSPDVRPFPKSAARGWDLGSTMPETSLFCPSVLGSHLFLLFFILTHGQPPTIHPPYSLIFSMGLTFLKLKPEGKIIIG